MAMASGSSPAAAPGLSLGQVGVLSVGEPHRFHDITDDFTVLEFFGLPTASAPTGNPLPGSGRGAGAQWRWVLPLFVGLAEHVPADRSHPDDYGR